MRRTVLRAEGQVIAIETGDAGTGILDAAGMVLALHGSDRHDEMVAEREAEGWQVVADEVVRPPEAGGAARPPDGPAGPAGEVDAGPSS